MADIHVQPRRRSRVNPSWMWTWLIIGIVIIAAVVYYVYANKDKDASNNQAANWRNANDTRTFTIAVAYRFGKAIADQRKHNQNSAQPEQNRVRE